MKDKINILIDQQECVGKWCSICKSICPVDAILINEAAYVDEEKCISCGKCAENICPNYAIRIIEEH